MVTFDGGVLDGAVHPLDLPVGPRMVEFREAMVDAVMVVDVEGRISLSNTATARITGYSAEQLKNLPVAKILIDDASGLRTVVRRDGLRQGAAGCSGFR